MIEGQLDQSDHSAGGNGTKRGLSRLHPTTIPPRLNWNVYMREEISTFLPTNPLIRETAIAGLIPLGAEGILLI